MARQRVTTTEDFLGIGLPLASRLACAAAMGTLIEVLCGAGRHNSARHGNSIDILGSGRHHDVGDFRGLKYTGPAWAR